MKTLRSSFHVLRPPPSILWLCLLVPLGFLWYRLIDHLRIEWTFNEQYGYGWAVPFLCAYLIWRNLAGKASTIRSQESGVGRQTLPSVDKSEVPGPSSLVPGPATSAPLAFSLQPLAFPSTVYRPLSAVLLFAALAFLYLPTRLIQEANPEWRLVSWALALIVIGLTLFLLRSLGTEPLEHRNTETPAHTPSPSPLGSQPSNPPSTLRRPPSSVIGPLLFFLVAVPWPTVIEGRLIQGLTRANAAFAVELVNLLGTPAVQHGNVIEVGSGLVGIDEACSGIRSFQASLMLALFFSLLNRLSVTRSALLCLAGFSLSFLFNLVRTTLLTMVASKQGIEAIGKWHDPASVAILLACFLSLWLLSLWLQRRPPSSLVPGLSSLVPGPSADPSTVHRPPSTVQSFLPVLLLAWLLAAEIGTETWYRYHERNLPAPVTWSVELPRENSTLTNLPFSEKTRQFLRFNEGLNASWREDDSTRWQCVFLRWDPGRIAVHLAKTHTPQACLPASGRKIASESDLQFADVYGLKLPFRVYTVQDAGATLHVLYCLWEDRRDDRAFRPESLTYGNRLAPVLAGRRNSGQRSIELAVWGIDDPELALRAFHEQLRLRIKPGMSRTP